MKRTALIAVAIVALVFGMVAYANANVTVNATVGAKASLTMVDSEAALGTVLPEASANDNVSFEVKANKDYTLSRSITDGTFQAADFGLAVTGDTEGDYPKTGGAGFTHVINYKITPTYNVDPGVYDGAYVYSVVPVP